jgi:hypothetical protein
MPAHQHKAIYLRNASRLVMCKNGSSAKTRQSVTTKPLGAAEQPEELSHCCNYALLGAGEASSMGRAFYPRHSYRQVLYSTPGSLVWL